jgi:hypothetical protein
MDSKNTRKFVFKKPITSWEFGKAKLVKHTRKSHYCNDCLRTIKLDSSAVDVYYMTDNRCFYFHPLCFLHRAIQWKKTYNFDPPYKSKKLQDLLEYWIKTLSQLTEYQEV